MNSSIPDELSLIANGEDRVWSIPEFDTLHQLGSKLTSRICSDINAGQLRQVAKTEDADFLKGFIERF